MAPTVTTASRHEYVGHALEEAIRNKVRARSWYRSNRHLAWRDWEHETNRELRLLFRIRREAIRQHADQEARVRRMWFERLEHARAERPVLTFGDEGPDVFYLDRGDHFAGMPS